MSRRKRHSYKCKVPFSVIKNVAMAMIAADWIGAWAGDADLQKSSAIWRKANGLFTVRLVYRSDSGSTTFVFRNIDIDIAGVEA